MLILNGAKAAWDKLAVAKHLVASRPSARSFAAISLSAVAVLAIWSTAHAGGIASGGCVGAGGSLSCVGQWGEAGNPYVRLVPAPANDTEKAQSAERDRKWEQRCRPVIAQDIYGVPRYQYSAPGCEFGVIQ